MSPVVARRIAWSLVGVLAGLALVLALPERTTTSAPRAAATPAKPADAAMTHRATIDAGSSGSATPIAAGPGPLDAATLALEQGGDLHALARQLLPRAEAGETEAQYSLAIITRECASELKRYADRVELDAFLETVPRRTGIDPEHYAALQRSRFEACDGFRADPLELYAADPPWLERAAAAGHPLAALELALQQSPPGVARDADALRTAARAALASGRPEAYMLLLELEFPDEESPAARDATPNAIAWWLLACERGYPCGPEVRWRREQLAFRGGQRGDLGWEDALLFELPAHEREQARERATELARALAAGELETLLPLALREPRP